MCVVLYLGSIDTKDKPTHIPLKLLKFTRSTTPTPKFQQTSVSTNKTDKPQTVDTGNDLAFIGTFLQDPGIIKTILPRSAKAVLEDINPKLEAELDELALPIMMFTASTMILLEVAKIMWPNDGSGAP